MPRPLWTPEQARANASKGGLAAARNRLINASGIAQVVPDSFTANRLTRIRKQLIALDDAIEQELNKPAGADGVKPLPDAQRIDRLAAASMRLSDQEFALANRPKPGQLRPVAQRSRSNQGQPKPLD